MSLMSVTAYWQNYIVNYEVNWTDAASIQTQTGHSNVFYDLWVMAVQTFKCIQINL